MDLTDLDGGGAGGREFGVPCAVGVRVSSVAPVVLVVVIDVCVDEDVVGVSSSVVRSTDVVCALPVDLVTGILM